MIWGAANFCPKNDLMHCVSLSKLRRFFLPKLRCSPKKKRSSLKFERYFGNGVPKYADYLPK